MPSHAPIGMDRYFNFHEKLCLIVINVFSVFMTVFLTQMITTVFPAYPSVMLVPQHNQSAVAAALDVVPGNCSVSDPDNIYVSILIGAKYCIEIVMFPIAGWITDKYHPPLVLLCGALVEALVCVVYSVSGNFYMTIFARSLDAIGYAIVSTSGLTIVYCLFGSERARNKVITIDSVSIYVSASVSPYVAGTIYEHFSQYSDHASRVATFLSILPLFLLLVIATVPFAFPGSWVSRLVLRRNGSRLAGHCCRTSSVAGDSDKPHSRCDGGSNGRYLHNTVLHKPLATPLALHGSALELHRVQCVPRTHTHCCTEGVSSTHTQPDEECVSPVEPDECVPLVHSDTDGVPVTEPDKEGVSPAEPEECVPLVHSDTDGVPVTEPDQECVPVTEPDQECVPVTQPDKEGVSPAEPEECVPLVHSGTDGVPVTHTHGGTDGVPVTEPDQECVSLMLKCVPSPEQPCADVSVVVPVSMVRLLRDPHMLVALCALLCNGLTNNSLETTLPIFMIRKFCATQQQQGAVFLFGFLSIVGFSGSSLLFHRHPAISWTMPMLGLLVSGGLCVALVFCRPWWTIGVIVGLLSFSSAITEVILIPVIAKIIDVKYAVSYGSASGLTMLTFTISGLIGTFPVGALVQRCGFLTLCALLCAVNCACAPFMVGLRRFFR